METSHYWREYFSHWPKSVPHNGVVVTTFNEQILFVDFMIADELLMLERKTPDTLGARRVLLPYSQILALKVVEIVKPKLFEEIGFRPSTA